MVWTWDQFPPVTHRLPIPNDLRYHPVSAWVDNFGLLLISNEIPGYILHLYSKPMFSKSNTDFFNNRHMCYMKTQFCLDRPWKLLPETLHLNCIYSRSYKPSACKAKFSLQSNFPWTLWGCVCVCLKHYVLREHTQM